MANLIRWRGRREVDSFRNEVDRLFDDFFTGSPFGRSLEKADWSPAMDVSEIENEIIVHAEIPGVDAKDIDVTIDGKQLTIKGERKQEYEDKDNNYHHIERRYGTFSRSFELPSHVDGNNIDAVYKDGVLTLKLPKIKGESIKRIEVRTS